jgi:uncharacterized protein YndB with AHSA1/START domain
MPEPEAYSPGPAGGATIEKDGETWTLVLVRQLRHSPNRVWTALTEPEHLKEWAPFDADGSLGTAGAKVRLTTVGAPSSVSETLVVRAEAPRVLQFNWGDRELRWELEPVAEGTRLTLWHNIDRNYIAMGAAGWHVCLDVLDRWAAGNPMGRLVGADAMKFSAWQRLHAEYSRLFKAETASK